MIRCERCANFIRTPDSCPFCNTGARRSGKARIVTLGYAGMTSMVLAACYGSAEVDKDWTPTYTGLTESGTTDSGSPHSAGHSGWSSSGDTAAVPTTGGTGLTTGDTGVTTTDTSVTTPTFDTSLALPSSGETTSEPKPKTSLADEPGVCPE